MKYKQFLFHLQNIFLFPYSVPCTTDSPLKINFRPSLLPYCVLRTQLSTPKLGPTSQLSDHPKNIARKNKSLLHWAPSGFLHPPTHIHRRTQVPLHFFSPHCGVLLPQVCFVLRFFYICAHNASALPLGVSPLQKFTFPIRSMCFIFRSQQMEADIALSILGVDYGTRCSLRGSIPK